MKPLFNVFLPETSGISGATTGQPWSDITGLRRGSYKNYERLASNKGKKVKTR
jgi:hypothetical protein